MCETQWAFNEAQLSQITSGMQAGANIQTLRRSWVN
jgi:hypothetical protein